MTICGHSVFEIFKCNFNKYDNFLKMRQKSVCLSVWSNICALLLLTCSSAILEVFWSLMMVLLKAFCISSICFRYLESKHGCLSLNISLCSVYEYDGQLLHTGVCPCSSPLAQLLQVASAERHVHLQGLDAVVESHEHRLLLAGPMHRVPVLLRAVGGISVDVRQGR